MPSYFLPRPVFVATIMLLSVFGSPAVRAQQSFSKPSRTALPNRGGFSRAPQNSTTIQGRLARVQSDNVAVRLTSDGKGKTVAHLQSGDYVAIVAESETAVGLLMEDRSVGWVNRAQIQSVDYSVILPTRPNTPPAAQEPAQSEPPATIGIPQNIRALLQEAFTYLGIRYLWGGTSRSGLDCSAFLQNVFATQNINLPRTAREQAVVGTPVEWEDLRSGDRLYFTMGKSYISHCGLYIANGYFIHSSSNHHGVAIDYITKPNYFNSLVAIRRSL